MTYDLFWFGDPGLVIAYREANELRNEYENQKMWIQGLYNFQAFRTVIEAFSYGLSGNKGQKPGEYPSEPFAFTEREQKASLERNKERTLAWVKDGQR